MRVVLSLKATLFGIVLFIVVADAENVDA